MRRARANKQIEVYNYVGSKLLGSSMGVLLIVSTGGGKVWEDSTPVDLVLGGSPMVYLGNYNYVRGRV